MTTKQSHSSMVLDGAILCAITALVAMNGTFGGDDAAKYIEPKTLFYLKSVCGWAALTLSVLKSFRSTAFAHHQQVQEAEDAKGNGQTEITTTVTPVAPIVTQQITSIPTDPKP